MTSPDLIWNRRYARDNIENIIQYSPWLDTWKHLLNGEQALDIGCGLGRDTEYLSQLGFQLTAIDLSTEALAKSAARNPQATHLQRDLSQGLKLGAKTFQIILAHLSLHYFDKENTFRIFDEIHSLLDDNGIFIFRVNAFGDIHHGSPEKLDGWELTFVDGEPKQFFTREKIEEVLANRFDILSLEKKTIVRYEDPKVLFECVVRKPGLSKVRK